MTSINRCNSCLNCNDKKSVFLVVPLSLSCLVKICFPWSFLGDCSGLRFGFHLPRQGVSLAEYVH
jgi:hypothetical protein